METRVETERKFQYDINTHSIKKHLNRNFGPPWFH